MSFGAFPRDQVQRIRCRCLTLPVFIFQMNDFVRDKFSEKDGTIPLPAEILAGGCVSIRL